MDKKTVILLAVLKEILNAARFSPNDSQDIILLALRLIDDFLFGIPTEKVIAGLTRGELEKLGRAACWHAEELVKALGMEQGGLAALIILAGADQVRNRPPSKT